MQGQFAPPPAPDADSGKGLTWVGIGLWVVGCLVGTFFLFWMFVVGHLGDPNFWDIQLAQVLALCLALPACFVYMWVPLIIDRYEPEPWYTLLMTFLWGALAAAGFSGFINTMSGVAGYCCGGAACGNCTASVISAPFTEEAFKGMAVLGMFWFMRREFDGVVDGVIYGTFAALGFAMTENVLYYSRELATGDMEGFTGQFLIRGVLKPWGHPLYASMTGIGVGLARESTKKWVKWVAPIAGYMVGVLLHMFWNGSAVMSAATGIPLVFVLLILYFFVLLGFLGIIIWLVRREGKVLRENLQDEVLMGNISQEDLDMICSAFGRWRGLMKGGMTGRRFVKAGIKLGMAKWHVARAAKGKTTTLSIGHIVPLRQEVMKLRQQMAGA